MTTPQREPGRDGVTGVLTAGRALRVRDISRPQPADRAAAEQVLADLLRRVSGTPRR